MILILEDIYFKFLQSLLKTDQHYLLKLFKGKTIKGLVQETLKVYLRQLKMSKQEETIYDY